MSGIPSWAIYRVGMRVQCINDKWTKGARMSLWRWLNCLWFGLPMKGGVYTITAIGLHTPTGEPGICLKGWGDIGFNATKFRPLVNDADDAEIEAQIYRKKHHRATRRVGEDA